jgi:methyltransferase
MSAVFWALYFYALAERLAELFLSRRNRSEMTCRGFKQREPARSLAVMVALHVAWLVAVPLESLYDPYPLPAWLSGAAAIAFCLAQILRVWTLRTLGAHWNVSVMTTAEASHEFVSSGPYSLIRHPNYLVVIVEIATLPLVGGAVIREPSPALVRACADGLVRRPVDLKRN